MSVMLKIEQKDALNQIFTFAKEIIEDLTRKGGSVPISLNSVDLSLEKINLNLPGKLT